MLGLLELLCAMAPKGLAKIVRAKLRENGALLDAVIVGDVADCAILAPPLPAGQYTDVYRQMEVEGWIEVERAALANYLNLTTPTEVGRAQAALGPVLRELATMLMAGSSHPAGMGEVAP